MASHHFLGTGLISEALAAAASRPEKLLDQVERRVTENGLAVVERSAVPFPGGGLTLVWVLAESHLVLHYWAAEGFATIDLHICDFQGSNAANARRLVDSLSRLCFVAGSDSWQELGIDHPMAGPTTAAATAPAAP